MNLYHWESINISLQDSYWISLFHNYTFHTVFGNIQVKIADLVGKIVGIYFSASWCGPCRRFTPTFVEAYNELYAKGDFEAVFASSDKDEESFKEYFAKMPWLAIPFSDSTTRRRLNDLFKVNGIPHLVILDGNGKVLSNGGVLLIKEYGVEAYPFSPEKLNEIKEEEEAARRNQSLSTLLVTQSRDFLISNDGNKVILFLFFCFLSVLCIVTILMVICECLLPNV